MSNENNRTAVIEARYLGCPERLWRRVRVPENTGLLSLAFFLLASFGAEGTHLFEMRFDSVRYVLFPEDVEEGDLSGFLRIGRDLPGGYAEEALLEETSFGDLCAAEGDVITLLYDFGHGHAFELTVRESGIGEGAPLLRVLSGEGKGILEERTPREIADLIGECDRAGGPVRLPEGTEWDIRDEGRLLDGERTADLAAGMLRDFLSEED